MENENNDNAIKDDSTLLYKKIQSVPKPPSETNIDQSVFDDLIMKKSEVDISSVEEFTRVSYRRNDLYNLIDEMGEDPIVSAILETYTEDATEYNSKGQIVWVESEDANTAQYITYLLNTMQVDKHIYEWTYSLIKYGDVYFRLFRQSDVEEDVLLQDNSKVDSIKKHLNEDVKIRAYRNNDPYVLYIEAEANPATMFELTRMGKTSAYIQTTSNLKPDTSQNYINDMTTFPYLMQYKFKKSEVFVCQPSQFVHAMLHDNSPRYEEEVNIFIDDNKEAKEEDNTSSYKVRRGQSMLFNLFKIWRELSLLENSIMLNRITKSAIVRAINIEIGDMPEEEVGPYLERIKSMMEQKSAIAVGKSMQEYTNPGPIENNIYVPTRDGKGTLTTNEIGGDVNITQLPDIEYFQNKFFGSACIPKQYFGLTDDGAGFNGGQSLAIISSRYAKRIKRIQSAMIQALTDIVNLILIDKGKTSSIGEFKLHMQPPTTQEEIDRRDSESSQVQIVSDIMNLLESNVEDASIKLEALKSLVATFNNGESLVTLIDKYLKKVESGEVTEEETMSAETDFGGGGLGGESIGSSEFDTPLDLDSELGLEGEEGEEFENEESLPTPEELGVDMTDNDTEVK